MIQLFLKYLIMGILSGYLLVYGLRPSVPYPEFILEPFEHNWLFIIVLILNYYVFLWDTKIGYLVLLSVIALICDYILFAKKHHLT